MKPKKNPKADLNKNSSLYFVIGLCVILFVSWRAIEWKTYEASDLLLQKLNVDDDDDEEVPLTEQIKTPPPPPPPPAPEIIEVVEDEEEERLLNPDKEDSTELGEVPQKQKKGTLNPGYPGYYYGLAGVYRYE